MTSSEQSAKPTIIGCQENLTLSQFVSTPTSNQTMKKPNPVLSQQPQMVAEYNQFIAKTGMTYNELTEALGVRYECINNRRKAKQTVTKEALLAIKYVVAEREATRLVAKSRVIADREENEADPLAGVF